MKKPYLFLIPLFFLAVLLSSCGFFSKSAPATPAPSSEEAVFSEPAPAPVEENTGSALQTYHNDQFQFSVDYPAMLSAVDYPDATGAGFYAGSDAPTPNANVMAAIVVSVDQGNGPLLLSSDQGDGRLFSDYVQTIGVDVLPNVAEADTVDPADNANGLTCYRTTWKNNPTTDENGDEVASTTLPVSWCYLDESHVLMFVLNDESSTPAFDAMVASARKD